MAGGLPTGFSYSNAVAAGVVTTQSSGTTITNSATANTKQAWVQLTSSTSTDADFIQISLNFPPANFSTYTLIDIGIGSSGSQQVIFANLVSYKCVAPFSVFSFPCSIPEGSALWARAQWDNANPTDTLFVSALLAQSSIGTAYGGSVVDTYGVQTGASPYTTQITLPTTDNTMSAWSSIATLSTDLVGFCLHLDFGGDNGFDGPLWYGLLNIGVGASGSQAIALQNIPFIATTPTAGIPAVVPSVLGYYPVPLASGTNIWAQAQVKDVNNSGATPRILGISFHGVRG